MTRRFRGLRPQIQLFVYVGLTVVLVVALFGYQRHTQKRLDQADRVSCQNRRVLIANQKLVLEIIERNLVGIQAGVSDPLLRDYFRTSRQKVMRAREVLAQVQPCR